MYQIRKICVLDYISECSTFIILKKFIEFEGEFTLDYLHIQGKGIFDQYIDMEAGGKTCAYSAEMREKMEQTKEQRMATEGIGKLMFSMAIPSVIAQIINILYSIVDRIYIGHIEGVGMEALTGVGVTFPIITLISAFSAFVGAGERPWRRSGWEKGTESARKRFLATA